MSGSDRLLTISSFGRAVGLPASALRHYAEAGVLAPAEVDPRSGYRYYSPAQLGTGVLVARLREAEVPLDVVRRVVTSGPGPAAGVLEELTTALVGRSLERRQVLAEVVAGLRAAAGGGMARTVSVPGPTLARALQQVLLPAQTATSDVDGVVWDLRGTLLTLAGTDRYWLAHHALRCRRTGRR